MADGDDLDAGMVQILAVLMAGVIILNGDDLAPGVRAALTACKMRSLRRVALRALNGRDRVEFPVCRAPAARFTARCFPFEVRHYSSPLPGPQLHAPAFLFSPHTVQRPRHSTLHRIPIGIALHTS